MELKNTLSTYADRFDPDYLRFLAERFDINTLKANAYEENRKDGHGTVKCIEVKYCGIAANTLLGNDTASRGKTMNSAVSAAKTHVARNFKDLFTKKNLDELKQQGYYLKVRFCFSYVYSDLPVSLIKAEESKNWEYIKDGTRYDYHYSKPINESELKKWSIYQSQQESLRLIMEILRSAYSNGHDLATLEKQNHSIHVRFTCIPSPLSMLILNNLCLCDSYLYGKLAIKDNMETTCSLHHPVSVITKVENMENEQFESIINHYKYLWRDDLTLFCGDATKFSFIENEKGGKKNRTYYFEGLTEIIPPNKIKWNDKISRIRESKRRHKAKNRNIIEILFWKRKLTDKFRLYTNKVVPDSIFHSFFTNFKRNLLFWGLATLLAFLGFFIYSLTVTKVKSEHLLELCKEHTVFEIIQVSLLFLTLLIIKSFAHND